MSKKRHSGPKPPLPIVGKFYRTGDGAVGVVKRIEMARPPRAILEVRGRLQRRKARRLTRFYLPPPPRPAVEP